MSLSRAKFKLALRFIKRYENQLRQDAIAEAMCAESEGNFWKENNHQIIYLYRLALRMQLEKFKLLVCGGIILEIYLTVSKSMI